jgi:hypothetical protein
MLIAASMQRFEHPGQGFRPGVEPRMGVARLVRAGDMRRDRRLATQMQARDLRLEFGGRREMMGEVVDENGTRRGILLDDPPQRRALRSLVGEHLGGDAVVAQLRRAGGVVTVAEVGQHDHVRLALQFADRRHGPLDRGLAVHLGVEEQVEIAPLLIVGQRFAAPPDHGRKRVGVELEIDAVGLAHPVAEVPHHVEQHLVTIGHHQRPAHDGSRSRAAARSAGSSPSEPAAASRSGSCAHR